MPVWIFRSSQTGLAGIQGSGLGTLIAALDACLVNGVNSSSTGWTASWAGGVATYVKTGHNMPVGPGLVLTISGFSPAGYNGTAVQCVATDANTITRSIADPSGTPATGTATVLRSPLTISGAAWTKSHSGTNLATYRQPTSGANGFYLAVSDDAAQNSRIRGFETASAAGPADGSGTAGFPSLAQLTGGGYQFRSNTNDTTARPWILVSNGKIIYFFNQQTSTAGVGNGFIFGDITTYKGSDLHHSLMTCDIAASATTTAVRLFNCNVALAATSGHWLCRSYTGTGGAVTAGKHGNAAFMNGATEVGAGGFTYPIGVEGGMMLTPLWISETTLGLRGHLPGLWSACHARPLTHGDTFTGATGTPLEGKSFEVFNGGSAAQLIFESSNTWDA
jgi:hypothetical protein